MVTEDDVINQYGKRYPAGYTIFKEGDLGEQMYIIHKGKVKITKKTDEGEKILVVLSAGDFFGEMAVIDKEPRSASAIAAEDTTCIVLNEELFDQQMQRNAKIVKKILKNMSARLRAADETIKNLTIKDNNMRVVNTLMMHVHKNGENIPFKISDLIQMASMEESKEKLMQILSSMEKARVIKSDGTTITLSSLDNLERYRQFLEMKKAFGED